MMQFVNLSEYNDLYVQSNTLLPADQFENFLNIYLEIYGLILLIIFLQQDKHDMQPNKDKIKKN